MQTLRLYCEVARYRSFSAAAARQGITQSAASQRIGGLERRLGITLLDRSVRPLALTPAGELFLRGCRELLERYDSLQQEVLSLNGEVSGQVEVAAIYSAGIDLLNRVREQFEQHHRGVSVTINYQRPDQVYQTTRGQHCDIGIVSYPQAWRDIAKIPLREEEMVVVCAASHELAGRRGRVHASELGRWPMLTFESELPVGRAIRRYLKQHDAAISIINVFDNIDTLKSAVAATGTWSILPRRTVLRELQAGSLEALDLDPPLARPIGIIYRRGRGNGEFPPAVQTFVDYLLASAGPGAEFDIADDQATEVPSL